MYDYSIEIMDSYAEYYEPEEPDSWDWDEDESWDEDSFVDPYGDPAADAWYAANAYCAE